MLLNFRIMLLKELVKDNWEIVTIVKSTVVKSIEIDF